MQVNGAQGNNPLLWHSSIEPLDFNSFSHSIIFKVGLAIATAVLVAIPLTFIVALALPVELVIIALTIALAVGIALGVHLIQEWDAIFRFPMMAGPVNDYISKLQIEEERPGNDIALFGADFAKHKQNQEIAEFKEVAIAGNNCKIYQLTEADYERQMKLKVDDGEWSIPIKEGIAIEGFLENMARDRNFTPLELQNLIALLNQWTVIGLSYPIYWFLEKYAERFGFTQGPVFKNGVACAINTQEKTVTVQTEFCFEYPSKMPQSRLVGPYRLTATYSFEDDNAAIQEISCQDPSLHERMSGRKRPWG